MDLDIDHYSNQDLLDLLEITDPTHETILDATNAQIKKYKNKDLIDFFIKTQTRLISTYPDTATFQKDNVKGTINPDFKNTVTRLINVDSAHRTDISESNLLSDTFEFELSVPIMNVTSISLYSVEIPKAWYNNTLSRGNTSFLLYVTLAGATSSIRHVISIPDGNYTTLSLPAIVATTIYTTTLIQTTVSVSPYTGLCTFQFVVEQDTILQLVWFDSDEPTMKNAMYNSNLGWMLGFRGPITIIQNGTVTSRCPVDTNGTKYITMVLNDYKSNRVNQNIVTINTIPHTPLDTPSYYNSGLAQYSIGNKINVIPTIPRVLTEKQIFTINAIQSQPMKNTRIRNTPSDTFAKIPLKKMNEWGSYTDSGMKLTDSAPCSIMVDMSGPLQLQSRDYFGPVDITNLSVSLIDDKGIPLNLNGIDWSFTLLVKSVYQY